MILYAKYGEHQPLNRQSEAYAAKASTQRLDLGRSCRRRRGGARPAHRLIAATSSPPRGCTATTRRCRYWPRARPTPAGYGPMCATIGRLPGPTRRRRCSSTRATVPASIPPAPGRYAGILQADAYAGFGDLYDGKRKPGPITEAACWSHGRRHFFEQADLRKAPLAIEAVQRIDEIFAIERRINGQPAGDRLAVRQKQNQAGRRRSRKMDARRTRPAVAQIRTRPGDPLHADALAGVYPLPRRRPPLPQQQSRRARAARHREDWVILRPSIKHLETLEFGFVHRGDTGALYAPSTARRARFGGRRRGSGRGRLEQPARREARRPGSAVEYDGL